MPPQQSDRLLDLFDQSFDFRAHVPQTMTNGFAAKDLTAQVRKRNAMLDPDGEERASQDEEQSRALG
jgi:hypothetical protein